SDVCSSDLGASPRACEPPSVPPSFRSLDPYPRGTGVTRWLALVCADELGGRQHLPLDRLLEFGLLSAGAKLELHAEGVQAEDIALAPGARRRAGAAVAGRAEVVLALARRPLALTQPACFRIESPAVQCVKTPPGASGSSTTSAND